MSRREVDLYVGLDAGATKTALLGRTSQSDETWTLTGPAANLQRLGLEGTGGVLAKLAMDALAAHPGTRLAGFCAGVAGAGREEEQAGLAVEVRKQLGDLAPENLLVVHDGEIAIESAFPNESGVIVICGTGSVVLARTTARKMLRTGGWGYLLGDEGSGNAIGIAGLQAVAHAFDGGPATALTGIVAEKFEITTGDILIHKVYQEKWPVQDLARHVAEAASQGDSISQEIIVHQAREVSKQVLWVAKGRSDIQPRIALFGGLTRHPYYRLALGEALAAALPGWKVENAERDPAFGALSMALRGQR